MNWQAFEDNMRENAQSHEIPVDTDALWERIQQKKKRRLVPFFWWITGALVLVGIGAGLTISLTSPRKAEMTGQETPALSQKNTAVLTGLPGKTDEKEHITTPASAVLPQSSTIEDGISTGAPIKNDPVIENQDAAQFVRSNTMNNEGFTEQNHSGKNPADTNEKQAATKLLSENVRQHQEMDGETLAFLSLPMPFLTTTPPTLSKPATKKMVHHTKRYAVIVGVETGYYLWRIDRTGVPVEIPRTNEKTLEAIHAGFTAKTNISRHLAVKTGIQYDQFNSVFRWTRQWDTLRARLLTYTYTDGHVDSIYNQDKVLYQYDRTVKNYNKITSFSIPVDISYAFHQGRWTFSPYAGAQVHFFQQSRGVITNILNKPDGRPYPKIYKQPMGFSLRTGISCELTLQHGFSIALAPSAIIDMTRRTILPYKEERFRQLGFTLGITKKLRF